MAGVVARIREIPVLFGSSKALVGIVAEPWKATPAAETRSSDSPAVLFLNAGIIHRVGPNRMYVQLARALAEAGVVSMRLDMSGIGDSPNRAEVLSPLESAMKDIREALDWLETSKQIGRVVLIGLCAGADHSILYASRDPRVVGGMLLDPTIPHTRKFRINRYGTRLSSLARKSPAEAMESLANLWRRNLTAAAETGTPEPEERSLSDDELRSMFEPHYRYCASNRIPLLAVMTGGVQDQHNYREQLLDAFPEVAFGDTLALEYLPQSDHAFTREADREQLRQIILAWMARTKFPRKTPS